MKYRNITIHKNTTCDTWYTRFRKNGKQTYISARTQKECYSKLKQAYANKGIMEEKKKTPTLYEWYQKWLELYKIGKVKEITINDYKTTIKNINKNVLNAHLEDIKVANIIEILNSIKAERQCQKLYELLKMVFQKAVDNEIIKNNIINRIDRPKHEKQHSKAMTNKEQNIFIDVCKKDKDFEFLLISLYQGLRKGEVLGITREDIDFEKNTLKIDKSLKKNNEIGCTKNKQSVRTMPLFEESKQILTKYENIKADERLFDISMKQHSNIMKKLKNIMPFDIKTKDLRATFITRCTEMNIPEMVIQSWVGHKQGSLVTKQSYISHNNDIDYKYIELINASKFNSNSTQQKN